jgi:hypothetical protein
MEQTTQQISQKSSLPKKNLAAWVRKIIIIIGGLFLLTVFLIWFFGGFGIIPMIVNGEELCNYVFMMPIDVKVERIEFPYDTESPFDTLTVRYHNLPIGNMRYASAIKYLFISPSFDIGYYYSSPDLYYELKSKESSIHLIKIEDYLIRRVKFGEFGGEKVIHIENKRKTEKLVTIDYYVPSGPLFIEKAISYSTAAERIGDFAKYYIKFDSSEKMFYIFERQPSGPAIIDYSSRGEFRTTKYKIIVYIPFNPLKGHFLPTNCSRII